MNKIRLWVLVMVTAGILTSCNSCDESLPDIFEGTWVGTDGTNTLIWEAIKGTWDFHRNSYPVTEKGIYTVSGNIVTLTPTQQWNGIEWIAHTSPYPMTGTISGNTLHIENMFPITRQQ